MNSLEVLGRSFSSENEAVAALQAELKRVEEMRLARRNAELSALPEKMGVGTIDELIWLLAKHASPEMRRRVGTPESALSVGGKSRLRLGGEDRVKIVNALKEGQTAFEVATEFGVSIATVYNIKRSAGLVKPLSSPKGNVP